MTTDAPMSPVPQLFRRGALLSSVLAAKKALGQLSRFHLILGRQIPRSGMAALDAASARGCLWRHRLLAG